MQVAFYLAGEITQVKESIPGVRCASGNVFRRASHSKLCEFCISTDLVDLVNLVNLLIWLIWVSLVDMVDLVNMVYLEDLMDLV